MISFPTAKINLGLRILRKRPDGYHDISSLFLPIPLHDALEVVEAGEFTFDASGLPIPGKQDDNLCIKAYELLRADFGLPPAAIYLHKVIPMGGGLGGGSSDAAFFLKMLNEKFGLDLPEASLEAYAARLGSDCPFFIRNKAAIASGTGVELQPVDFSLNGYHLLLLFPGLHVGTKEAYAGVKPRESGERLEDIISSLISTWKHRLINDFEASIFPRYPLLGDLKEKLYQQGAVYASMTGSGSTLYGIFEEEPPPLEWPKGVTSWKGKL